MATSFSLQASSRLAFRERYMQRFLPLLSCIQEKSAMKRYKAVKKAADFSLACTAGRTSWSKALCRRLSVNGRAKKQRTRKRKSSGSSIASEAGLAFLKRLRRRRIRRARAQAQPLNYRKSFLQAQKKQRKSKLQVTHNGKLEDTQVTNRLNMTTQYGKFEASKLSSLSELIPGGLHMDIPKLLDQTAHYMISLQLQVDALSFLAQTLST